MKTPIAPMATEFAPAEKVTPAEIHHQVKLVSTSSHAFMLMDCIPSVILILNRNRQIVFANKAVLSLATDRTMADVVGLRPGEVLGCIHALESEGGCGTTKFCKTCGSVNAILKSLTNVEDVEECRINILNSGDALDLRIWATPLTIEDQLFVVFTAVDISHEKRRRALERIFFHDILNVAVGLRGFSELSLESDRAQTEIYLGMIRQLAENIIDEINSQRDLASAENFELKVHPVPIQTGMFLRELCQAYARHPSAQGREVTLDPVSIDAELITDQVILRRILGNMVKNALEASKPGDTVTLGCVREKSEIVFRVHNPSVIPEEVQLQIFQRSFSTKGPGRGLGTFSIKLLSERYLNGSVSFRSTAKDGTTFFAHYRNLA